MTANLTPQYFEAEERYRKATDDRTKLNTLREMLQLIPKHKGTEKLQAEIKKKIAALRMGTATKGGGSHRAPTHGVERSGAAQVALVGPPNSGKSRFVADLSSAKPEVAEYPFTTRTPTPGIVTVDLIPIQFVDLPPITGDYFEPWLTELIRNADLLLVMLDLGADEILEHWEGVANGLAKVRCSIAPPPPENERELGMRYLPSVLAGNRADLPDADVRLEILFDLTGPLPLLPFSLETKEGLDAVLAAVVKKLNLVRLFTKAPGKEPDMTQPFVLPRGATVEEAARHIHKDLAEKMKFARAWGARFHDGQPVGRDLVLEDGDILEFHG